MRGEKEVLVCPSCGKTFKALICRHQKYCSATCYLGTVSNTMKKSWASGKYLTRRKRVTKWINELDRRLFVRYGIRLTDYNLFLKKQKNACAICGRLFGRRRPSVDHDHITNRFRGILCYGCNSRLGHLEMKGWLQKARAYLRSTAH